MKYAGRVWLFIVALSFFSIAALHSYAAIVDGNYNVGPIGIWLFIVMSFTKATEVSREFFNTFNKENE